MKRVKVRYLFLAAIAFAFLAVVGLRINQGKASELTRQVVVIDQAGGNVETALSELRDFVVRHMNTSTRVELAASYERAARAARTASTAVADEELLAAAQARCDRPGVSSVDQAECVREFLENNMSPGNSPEPVDLPEKSQFTYAFVSPLWTPDLAGLSLLAASFFAATALIAYFRRHILQPPNLL